MGCFAELTLSAGLEDEMAKSHSRRGGTVPYGLFLFPNPLQTQVFFFFFFFFPCLGTQNHHVQSSAASCLQLSPSAHRHTRVRAGLLPPSRRCGHCCLPTRGPRGSDPQVKCPQGQRLPRIAFSL